MTKESPRRSTGKPIENKDGYLPNGKPNLMPTAGYEGHEPVQYSDENDQQFAGRVAMFKSAYATAVAIENADGKTQDSYNARKEALDAQYDADLANLDSTKTK